jgi:hypothetical protein
MEQNTITVSAPHSDQAEGHAKNLIQRMGMPHLTNVSSGAFVHNPQRAGNVTIAFSLPLTRPRNDWPWRKRWPRSMGRSCRETWMNW